MPIPAKLQTEPREKAGRAALQLQPVSVIVRVPDSRRAVAPFVPTTRDQPQLTRKALWKY